MTPSSTAIRTPDFIHVNLLPIEYRVVRKDYSYLIDMRILLSVSALILVSVAYLVGQSFFKANLEAKKAVLAEVEREIGENAYVAARIKELENLRDEKTAKNNSLKSISVSKRKWVRILEGVKGTGAVTRTLVGTTDGTQRWDTVGVHENVIAASWMALEDAFGYGLLGVERGD